MICLLVCIAVAAAVRVSTPCGASDNADDCRALVDFGRAMNVSEWTVSTNWLAAGVSVCDWHGISCDFWSGRVTGIYLPFNNVRGQLPDSLGMLSHLTDLNLNSISPLFARQLTILNGTTIPYSVWSLPRLQLIDLAGSFVGGDLPADIGNRAAAKTLTHIRLPHCLIKTRFHASFANMTALVELKLERNPVFGAIPFFAHMPKLEKLACNFCALTGAMPDCWTCCPKLQHLVFDGNGLSGELPPSIASLTKLQELGLNINNFSSAPAAICAPFGGVAGTGRHCHVGSDRNLTAYDAQYPWIIPSVRNIYACPLPACMVGGGACNSSKSIVAPCVP